MTVDLQTTVCHLAIGELAHCVHGRLTLGTMPPISGVDTPLARVVIDSRQVEPGDVFWALPGSRCNGIDYCDDAYARGASGVVAAGRHIEPWAGRWAIEVDDTHWALWQLAALIRRRFMGQVIAVTGSVGKSTTRQMLHAVLGSRLAGTASPRNYNNHIGLPLSMAAWREADDYAVVELGASRSGEIDALSGLCQPRIGVITAIANAHLQGFGSLEAVAHAKTELLAALPTTGWAILNGDDPLLRRKAATCRARKIWVGRAANCDLVATDVHYANGLLQFCVDQHAYRVPVWGRHHLTAALAAIAAGQILDLPVSAIAEALAGFEPLPQRCQVRQVRGITIIDDSYNANPRAMHAALELLRDFDAPGRRIVACGDMVELGDDAKAWHCKVGSQVVTVSGADLLVACGEYARDVALAARDAGMPLSKAVACRSPQEAAPVVRAHLAPGDVVLVKGSRKMEMERLVEAIEKGWQAKAA